MPKAKLDNAYEILLDYGYIKPGVSDREYWEALKQATLDFKEENNIEYFDIVRAEEKELRDKVVPRVKKKKITGAAFKKGTSQESVENIQSNTEVTSLAIREPRPDVTSSEITPETLEEETVVEPKQPSLGEGFKNILNSIAGSTESIKNLLLGQQEADKQAAKDVKRKTEDSKRKGKEKKIESRVFDGLKKVGEKIISPVKGLLGQIWEFIKTLFLSAVVGKLIDWFQNPENQQKVQSVFRFIKDWWPALLTGFLLFGTGIGSLITGTVAAIGGFIPVLVGMLPKLLAFLASPIGLAVLGTAAVVGGGMWLAGKMKGDGDDKKIEGGGEEKSPNEDKTIGEGGKIDTGKFLNMPTPTENGEASQKFSNFNKGGSVPGKGNTDTVPAMLTPGEFVLTKEATEKYGTDTLEGMNAAAATGKDETSGTGRLIGSTIGGFTGAVVGFFADTPVSPAADIALGIAGSAAGGEIGDNIERKITGKGNKTTNNNNVTNATQSFRNGGLVQYLNNGGKVQETSWGWNANTRNGRVVSGNVSQEQYDNEMRINKLEDEISEMEFYAETPAEKKELIELKTEAAKLGSMFYSEYLPGSEHYDLVIQEKIDAGIISSSAGKRLMKMQKSIQQPQTNLMWKSDPRRSRTPKSTSEKTVGEGGKIDTSKFLSTPTPRAEDYNSFSTKQNATLQGGQVTSGNMNQSNAEKMQQRLKLEKHLMIQKSIHGRNSPEANEIRKQILILQGTPAEAIYTDRKGNLKIKGYSNYSGEKRRSIPNKSQKNPANFLQPQGFQSKKDESKKGGGLGRLIGGIADVATLGMFDFDNKSGGGLLRKVVGGTADALTGNRWDFDNQGKPEVKSEPPKISGKLKPADITPPVVGGAAGKPNITTMNLNDSGAPIPLGGGNESAPPLPDFSPIAMRSRDKIKTLGIMV